jgi:hypothetical protein
MSIGPEVRDHPPNEVKEYSTIEGFDLDRFREDSGRKKPHNHRYINGFARTKQFQISLLSS